MAFGLFGKKPPEKMQAKPAAKPRGLPDPGPATRPPAPAPAAKPAAPPPVIEDDDLDLDFTGIRLEEETDPLQAVIEQAAIAYANEHEDEAYAVLSDAIRETDNSPESERLWLMLFDLCQIMGRRKEFSELELDYAQRFEKQPPSWKESATAAAVTAATGAATLFKGDLVIANAAGFEHALQALEKSPNLRLDLGKVGSIDADGCQRFLDLLARARKLKREVELLGLDKLGSMLEPKIAAEDRNQSFWVLMLEVLQRQFRQEDFDNVAVSFAILFEISPPAYEPPKVGKPEKAAAKPGPVKRPDDAFYLEGELLGGRVDGLDAWFQGRDRAVIDMSGVMRVDFTSAGTMLNIMMTHWQRGMTIIMRHPNRMVAELLTVVGVSEMATIEYVRK